MHSVQFSSVHSTAVCYIKQIDTLFYKHNNTINQKKTKICCIWTKAIYTSETAVMNAAQIKLKMMGQQGTSA